jgi:hypothetical protein
MKEPNVGESNFMECDWSDFYPGAKGALPPNALKPLGKDVMLQIFIDSNHTGDKVSRCSRNCCVIFFNKCMIDWLSKKQSTVKISVFGMEICIMKHSIDNLCGIPYKLHMMGAPIKGSSYVYGENMSVVTNAITPEPNLRKKSNSICHHAVREAIAIGKALVAHILTKKNLAGPDLFTKALYGQTRRFLVDRIPCDVFPSIQMSQNPPG